MAVAFSEMFLEFLRRNVMVAVVILVVLLARLLLKKFQKNMLMRYGVLSRCG